MLACTFVLDANVLCPALPAQEGCNPAMHTANSSSSMLCATPECIRVLGHRGCCSHQLKRPLHGQAEDLGAACAVVHRSGLLQARLAAEAVMCPAIGEGKAVRVSESEVGGRCSG